MTKQALDQRNLELRILNIKKRFLNMYKKAKANHVGSSLSCTEILSIAKLFWMEKTDYLVLSKGHAAAALYSVLCENGEVPESDLNTYYENNTYYSAHPPPNALPGIPFATGSLGHGLSLSVGLALGLKLRKDPHKVFCVTSDGELDEGSTWEAALVASHFGLDNLTWIVDRNFIQGFGRTEEVLKLEPLDQKISSFGWEVKVCDGHNLAALNETYQSLNGLKKPRAIIAKTIKGRGQGKLEDTVDCHYLPISDEELSSIIKNLENRFHSTYG